MALAESRGTAAAGTPTRSAYAEELQHLSEDLAGSDIGTADFEEDEAQLSPVEVEGEIFFDALGGIPLLGQI